MSEAKNMVLVEAGKNLRECVRLERVEYKGHELLSVRVYYRAADGTWKPTRKGINMKADAWRGIAPALVQELGEETPGSIRPGATPPAGSPRRSSSTPPADALHKVVELADQGMSQADIARALELNRSTVSRHFKRAAAEGLFQTPQH
jgi:hypothetical protein